MPARERVGNGGPLCALSDFRHQPRKKRVAIVQVHLPLQWNLVNQVKPTRSFPRRLLRHFVGFVLVSALLLGPNLVFYGRWTYPDQILPTVQTGSDDRVGAPGLASGLSDDLLAALRASREKAGLPSLSAAIGYDGKLQWAGATGFADTESKQSATTRSRYRTGSVAKPLTAVALVRL